MAYSCRILADSIGEQGHRLTTFELIYPRIVHSEFMTHRAFSRNAASTRAIPFKNAVAKIESDLFSPIVWPKNGSGMVSTGELDLHDAVTAKHIWWEASQSAIGYARALDALGVHKSITGRLLEPFAWITVLASATEWENFFHLRVAPDAEPHIREIATMMQDMYRSGKPRLVIQTGAIPYHLPLIRDDDIVEWSNKTLSTQDLVKISVGRCARVSYLTHDGRRDVRADIELHDRLAASGHWSPFEHVALATPDQGWSGNFQGWIQYRKTFDGECYTE